MALNHVAVSQRDEVSSLAARAPYAASVRGPGVNFPLICRHKEIAATEARLIGPTRLVGQRGLKRAIARIEFLAPCILIPISPQS